MALKYSNLLSPIKVGGVILKNRMMVSSSIPHYVQGREPYPTERTIDHFAMKARNGAAAVTVSNIIVGKRHEMSAKYGHPQLAILDDNAQIYFSKLTEAIHFYGSCAVQGLMQPSTGKYDVCNGKQRIPPEAVERGVIPDDVYEMPKDEIEKFVQSFVEQAVIGKAVGFDMATVHLAYRSSLAGRFLSPLTNHRTDEFGGDLEGRAKLAKMILGGVKKACGQDYPIEVIVSACEPDGGATVEDTIKLTRLLEGYADIIQVRAGDIDSAHPTGFEASPTPFAELTERVKASNPPLLVCAIAGYQDLANSEKTIGQGKADLISMARSWIADFDYGKKAYEGRGEDVVPCVRCNKCHMSGDHMTDPYVSVCTVNPKWGLEGQLDKLVSPPERSKNIAVVGGGPAGMEAAIVAAQRGHSVTLYEKDEHLGGQLIHADYPSFKWPMRNFKNYLIRQLDKEGVKVYLNTEANPELLRDKYDEVVVAIGAEPDMRDFDADLSSDVWSPIAVYGREAELGKRVLVIGGGSTGVETGMYLAETGHDVVVVTRQDRIAHDADTVHYRSIFEDAWKRQKNFSWITEAGEYSLKSNVLTYRDKSGKECRVEADSIVVAGGVKPLADEAIEFKKSEAKIHIVGDCLKSGNVQKAMRSAFAAASGI